MSPIEPIFRGFFLSIMHKINSILTAFMILVCVIMAGFFLFTDIMKDTLFGTERIVFIIVLLTYALYRAYRLRVILREQKEEGL
jgi:hypothetical protein